MSSASGGTLTYGIFAYTEYSVSSTNTTTTLTVTKAVARTNTSSIGATNIGGSYTGTGQTTKSVSGKQMKSSADVTMFSSFTWSWARGTTAQTKTIQFKVTYAGGTSTASFNVTVPALASYTVGYNANGGSGTIASQTKYYGINLNLSGGTGFTRTNHSLIGWNTASDGTGTHYELGDVYSANAGATLYAEWHLDYIPPVLTDEECFRVASAGSTTETDNGDRIHIGFDYVGGTIDGGVTYIVPNCRVVIDGTQVIDASLGSTSGSYSTDFGTYSKDTAHTVVVTVYDSTGTFDAGTSFKTQISTATYPIDLVGSGNDVYMGIMTPAETGEVLKLHEFKTENMYLDLSDYATSGTTDKKIYDVLVALGWDSDVIV